MYYIIFQDDIEIPNEPEIQLQNASVKSTADNKRNKSPSSPMPYRAVELQGEAPPNKRRKTRESINAEKSSVGNNTSGKDSDSKTTESQAGSVSDPVEIIPLMPNLKIEMPEYLEQDGSSCSYEDQSIGDNALNKIGIDDTSSNTPDHDQKIDISHTFYSSQSTSDGLDGKHQSSDVGRYIPILSFSHLYVEHCPVYPSIVSLFRELQYWFWKEYKQAEDHRHCVGEGRRCTLHCLLYVK